MLYISMIGGAYVMIRGSGSVCEYSVEHRALREMYMTYTCVFTCLALFDNQSLEGGSISNSQNVMYMRYMLVVLHHIIHIMVTVIMWAKFEHMVMWNSFCGTYLMAFLIVHGEKGTWFQIDHFLCLLHLCYFCTSGRGICCIANTLGGSAFWLFFFTLGHYSF